MIKIYVAALLFSFSLLGDVKSTTGQILFDTEMDQQEEMTLNSTGLGIGISPSANLHVNGNAILSGKLFIGSNEGSSNINIHGTLGYGTQTVTSNTTLGTYSMILADSSSDNITLTLPYAGNAIGSLYNIKKISTNNNVYITSDNLIDGYSIPLLISNSSSASMPYVKVISDGINWHLLNDLEISDSISMSNLVIWLQLNESQGAVTAIDASPSRNHGTYQNFTSSNIGIKGINGNAAEFDGSNDYISLAADSSLNSDIGSVSAFFKSDTPHEGHIFYASPGSSGDGYGGEDEFHVNLTSTEMRGFITGMSSATSTVDYHDDQWHHVVFTWDTSGQALLYIDNVQVASRTHNGNSFTFGTTIHIGKPNSNIRYFKGLLDDIRVYNKVLTTDEIEEIYNLIP